MKKIIFSALAASLILQAAEHPYKIFVETYSNEKDPAIDQVYTSLKAELKDFSKANVIKRASDSYYVVVVEGIMEKKEANQLLSKIKSLPGHSDAFILPAPELLNASENKPEQTKVDAQLEVIPTPEEEMPDNSLRGDLLLNDVIKTVLSTNPTMQERISEYMKIGKDLKIANNAYYPTLDLTGSYGYQKIKNNSTNKKFEDGTRGEAALTLTQNLYNGNADSNRIKQEHSRLDSAAFLVAERADRLALDAVNAYLNVAKEHKLLDLARQNTKVHEEIYLQIKDRAQSGFGKASEERQAGSRLTLSQTNLISQENNFIDSLSTFEKLYGKAINSNELAWPEFDFALPKSEEEVYDKALVCNPTIKSQEANIQLAYRVKDGTNAAFRPVVDLEGSAQISKNDIGNTDDREDRYSAFLKVKYNIFNKGNDSLQKEKAQVSIQKEQQTMDSLRRNLTESLKFSWQSYTLSDKKMDYVKEHVAFSKETLDSYEDEFRIGRRDLINLLDAQNEYFDAEKELIRTEYDLLFAKYRLLDNMGLLADSFEPGFAQKYIKSACTISQNIN